MGRYSQDSGGGDFVQAPPGTYVARCVRLIDLGTQHGEYEGRETIRNQVFIQWELPTEKFEYEGEERPILVGEFYTNSLNEKAKLRKHLESWRSRKFTEEELAGFDLENILNAPCMLSIVHNDSGKAKVSSVSAMPKGMECAEASTERKAFWIEPWNEAEFQELGDGFKRMIMASDEAKAINSETSSASSSEPVAVGGGQLAVDDDIPF